MGLHFNKLRHPQEHPKEIFLISVEILYKHSRKPWCIIKSSFMFPIYALKMGRPAVWYSQNIIYHRNARSEDSLDNCLGHIRDMLRISLINAWHMVRMCFRYAWNIPELCLRYASYLSEISLKYIPDGPTDKSWERCRFLVFHFSLKGMLIYF